jgi:CRP-like cAMP-binding protein
VATNKRRLEAALSAVPLFEGLSRRHLRRLAGLSEVADYMAGHSIVREGEPGDAFYVVLAGQGTVTAGGKRLRRVLPGDHFGEISLLDGGPRSATVSSETPMTLLVLERPRFLQAMREEPEVALKLAAGLARQVRRSTRSVLG